MTSNLDPAIWEAIHAPLKSLTRQQEQHFLQEINRVQDPRKRALGLVLYYTGARISEVLAIKQDHICDIHHFVAIKSLKLRNSPMAQPYRCIPIPSFLVELLLSLPVMPDKRLFKMHRTTALRWLKPIFNECGFVGATATTRVFRHALDDRSTLNEIPDKAKLSWLGHTATTNRAHYGDRLGYEFAHLARRTWEVTC